MPRIRFHQQLDAIRDKLLAMAALSQQALELALEAYVAHDMALCTHVGEIEQAVNAAHREVDQMAHDLLAMEQPMAVDLRFLLSVVKINGELERIGDHASNIAQRAAAMRDLPPISLPVDIQDMGDRVRLMIRRAIQALLEANAGLAEFVLTLDDEIDSMDREVQAELLEVLRRHPVVSSQALNAITVSRSLERAADHATNIAEDVIFWVRGSDVRHQFSLAETL